MAAAARLLGQTAEPQGGGTNACPAARPDRDHRPSAGRSYAAGTAHHRVLGLAAGQRRYWSPSIESALIKRIGQSAFDDLPYRLRHGIEFSLASGCAVDLFADSDDEYRSLQEMLGNSGEHVLANHSDGVYMSAFLEEPDDAAHRSDRCSGSHMRSCTEPSTASGRFWPGTVA